MEELKKNEVFKQYDESDWRSHAYDYKLVALTFDDGPAFNTADDKASAVNHRNNNPRSTEVRRQQPQRVANGGSVNKSSSTVRTQQPRRMPTGAVKSQSGNKNSQSGRVSTNGERKPQSSSSSNSNNSRSSYRSSSSSSGEYNRPSSTSVARQRSSSSGGHSMSGGARSGAVPRGGSRR